MNRPSGFSEFVLFSDKFYVRVRNLSSLYSLNSDMVEALAKSNYRDFLTVTDKFSETILDLSLLSDLFFNGFEKQLQTLKELEQSSKDSLTGLSRREVIPQTFVRLAKTALRNDQKLFVSFLDVDNFKEYNDILGHNVGDIILQLISNILIKETRSDNFVCRYGGDEFLVLMPAYNQAETSSVLQRINHSVGMIRVSGLINLNQIKVLNKNPHLNQIGVSYGLAELKVSKLFSRERKEINQKEIESVFSDGVAEADKVMYKNKKDKKKDVS